MSMRRRGLEEVRGGGGGGGEGIVRKVVLD